MKDSIERVSSRGGERAHRETKKSHLYSMKEGTMRKGRGGGTELGGVQLREKGNWKRKHSFLEVHLVGTTLKA